MNSDNYITEELKNMSPFLKEIIRTEVYSVPSFYFNNLSAAIIDKINLNKERAYFFDSSTPYSIPADYFNNLANTILQKVVAREKTLNDVFEEMEAISPILNTISKKMEYNIPINFFDKIPLASVEPQKQKANVVTFKRRSKLFKVAAAAIIIPFLAIGLYTLTGKEFMNVRGNNSNAKNRVKNLSKEEIVNYLKRNSLIENASSTSKNTSVNDNEIKSSLKQISDKEIQQFLKETGESDEI